MLELVLVLASFLFPVAQTPSSPHLVSGRVVTGEPPAPVAGATVRTGNLSVTTDANGGFLFEVTSAAPAATGATITINAAGFQEQTLDVAFGRPVEVSLRQSAPRAVKEEVDVTADSAATRLAPPTLIVGPAQVLAVAGALDNVFRVLQTMPGVSATDDFGSRLSVRGGGPDQNLTIMDGVEIHNPYRLFGLTSAFNPETIDRFALTAGGFAAPYGDRLSSILVIDNRDGTTAQRFAGSTALSVTDANVVLEGRLPKSQSGSWLLTGRRTYYDIFAERVTDSDLPSFNDVQAKVALTPRPGHRLSLFGLRSREDTDAEFGNGGRNTLALEDASFNDVLSATYSAPLGSIGTSRTIAAWYHYRDALDVAGSVQSDFTRSNAADDDEATQQSSIVFTRAVGVRDLSLREELSVPLSSIHTLNAGLEAHKLSTTWGWTIAGDRNNAEANGSSVLGGAGLPSLLDSIAPSSRGGVWLEDDIRLGSRAHVTAGVRADWSDIAHDTPLSPRLRATIDLSPATHLKIAAGRYTQSPGYEKLLQSDYFVDLSNNHSLDNEESWHFVGGIEYEVSSRVSARIEGYYKSFDKLIVGRLETPDETAARIVQYDFPASLAFSVPTASAITTTPGNGARGRAYGFDVYVQKRGQSPRDRLTGWLSYTWGRAVTEAYGRQYPFDYDRRHAASLVTTWRMTERLDLGATLRAASGFPETKAVGIRVASVLKPGAVEGAPQSLIPQRDGQGRLVWTTDNGTIDNLNTARLPTYLRMDVRLTYAPSRASRWQLYLEVINATKRENAGGLTPELHYSQTSDRPELAFSRDAGLPLLPSFGLRVRF